jgi:hypothetical protein
LRGGGIRRRGGQQFLCEILAALVQIATALSRDGVDRDGINAVLEHERAELKTWRKKSPPELPGWLERSGANLH